LRLRSKLGLILAVLVVPFAVGVSLWQTRSQQRGFEEGTAVAIVDRMDSGERELCEAAPERWPRVPGRRGRRRGPPGLGGRVFAYDASFHSASPRAPSLEPELREALSSGAEVASVEAAGGRGRIVAVRMPWDEGPCAIVTVRRPAPPFGREAVRTLVPVLAVSAAAVLLAIVAAGPIVRRIRRLTEQVRAADASSAVDVGGRDEITELARAFTESRARISAQIDELERRDSALRSYMANTTHDVMIPVTVLQGHLAEMERALREGSSVEASRLRGALEEVHYLASLLHNLNAVARLEMTSEEPRRDRVDIGAVVERVFARHAPFARQRSIELNHAVPEGETHVLGDVTLLEQAIGNLVHNAIRYNHEAGHVAVVLERGGETFRARVLDDGPGIPEGELRRVEERGFRGDEARSRHPHGLGLGLHIARDVAERHGFVLHFHAREPGLEVSIEGPLAPPREDT